MATHPWSNYVLGGVDKPRILLLSDNFCANQYLNNDIPDTGDWQESFASILTRAANANAYGEYMARINYTSDLEYAYYTYNYDSAIANKRFLLVFDAISSVAFKATFYGSSEFGSTNFNALENKTRCMIIADAISQTGNNISIRIYGTQSTGNADLYFDNIMLYEVTNDYTFDQPHDSGKLIFVKDKTGDNELWNGKKQEYNVKWIPNFICNYEIINYLNEMYRQDISEADNVFCIPHKDVNWGFVGRWNEDNFTRDYAFSKYFGHRGIIDIISNEYFKNKPIKQVSSAVYSDEQDLII